MIVTCPAIVLSSIPYSETSVICRAFTREYGLNSFLLKGAKTGRNKSKSALLRPLQVIDITHYRTNKSSLHLIKEITCNPPFIDLYSNPEKTCISLFLAELIGKTIPDQLEDQGLFDFLSDSVHYLDLSSQQYVNFHLQFIVQYFKSLGLFPTEHEVTSAVSTLGWLPSQQSLLVALLENPSYSQVLLATNIDRKLVLRGLLSFLENQLGNPVELKSLLVLESVFAQ